MKTTVQITVLLLIGMLFTVISCTKDKNMDDEHKDWNVLEWTVDGERAKANCEGDPLFGCDPVDCEYYHDIKYLHISGGSNEKGGIIIHKHRDLKEGVSNFLQNKDYMKYGGTNFEDTCTTYISDTTLSYRLFIEQIDTINKIIVGNYSFSAIDNCQDTVVIKDGYFKLSYRP